MTIYKTKIKKYAGGAGMAKLAGGMNSIAPIAGAISGMLPQEQIKADDPMAGRKQGIQTAKTITAKGIGMAGQAFGIPGLEEATTALDKVGTSVKDKGEVAQYYNSLLNPLATVDRIGNTLSGDLAGAAEYTPQAILANKAMETVGLGKLYGKNSILGESDADKAKRQAEIDAVTNANKQVRANNAGANARYVKHGGSINRILRASKGLSFQLGLLSKPKQNEFKVGGVLPSYHTNKNVILAGVLHKDDHNICELEDKSCGVIYGKKGIPVVSNNQKVAEIEKEELVFTKDVAKQIDVLVTKYNKSKSNDVKLEIGKYIYEQLNVNTIDNTKI